MPAENLMLAYLDWLKMTSEMQQVVFMRTLLMAGGGEDAYNEAGRMVREKMMLANLALYKATMAFYTGQSLSSAGSATIREARKKVRSNHRRLSRRKP
jgi:hypothetical protein